MTSSSRRVGALFLSACVLALVTSGASASSSAEPPHPASLDEAIIKSAARHGIPESLVRRIVMRESKYNPRARNHLYWGLMQISYPTAKSMGFKGSPQELLNPVINLRYAVPYLANAFIIAGKRQDAAVRLYAAGYYNTAKQRGLLGMLRTADSAPLSGVPDEPELVASAAPLAPPPEQSTGIFGALFGPQQMQRDPQTQELAYAAAPESAQVQPAPSQPTPSAALPGGKTGDDVALVTDKHGDLQPPKKWQRDGGTTVIARGEQAIEQVAAFDKAAAPEAKSGRHRKTTTFASIDQPPASAQAYAAPGAQDPRLMQADSQAAIAQATSGQAVPPTQQFQQAATPPDAGPVTTVAAEEPKKTRKRHVARRGHHHDAPGEAVAEAPAPQAAPAPEGQPQPAAAQQAVADPQQQQAAAAPQAQPAVDASGYPVDAGGPQQQAEAAAPAKPKRHAHRVHPHKTAVAAVQDDAKPQPAAQ